MNQYMRQFSDDLQQKNDLINQLGVTEPGLTVKSPQMQPARGSSNVQMN